MARLSSVFAGFAGISMIDASQWWEMPGGFRTVSPACDGMNAQDLTSLADELHASGATALTVNSAYDAGSGYNSSNLWCGLAMSDLQSVNPLIGTTTDWHNLVAHVHSNGMKIMTWLNPSYVWTGSKHFVQAEKDVKKYGINNLPTNSPARWFKWETKKASTSKPLDTNPPAQLGGWQWVWDGDAGASYFSTWGNQPCTDWSSTEWQVYFKSSLSFWINDMGVDGFVFDYPDGYISAGYDGRGSWSYSPSLIKQHITEVIHSLGAGSVASFAELYQTPDRDVDYGFDASLSDSADNTGQEAIATSIINGNSNGLEQAFTGYGGPDSLATMCYYTWGTGERCGVSWTRRVTPTAWFAGANLRENDYNCYSGAGASYAPDLSGIMSLDQCFSACYSDSQCAAITVDWDVYPNSEGERQVGCYKRGSVNIGQCDTKESPRYSTFDHQAVAKMRLVSAISMSSGNMDAVEFSGGYEWWSDAPWPGSEGDSSLPTLYTSLRKSKAFSLRSLRMKLGVGSKKHYAMLRYDAKNGGDAALAVFNFGSTSSAVSIDTSILPSSAFSLAPKDLLTDNLTQKDLLNQTMSIQVGAFGYSLLSLQSLPSWDTLGYINCYLGAGATYAPESSGNETLGACLVSCLSDSQCTATTVQWLAGGGVTCWLRGGLTASKCDTSSGQMYSTFVVSGSSVQV